MRKKQKIRRFRIQCDLYPYAVYIITGGTKQRAIDWFDVKFKGEKKTKITEATHGSMIFMEQEMSHVIWFLGPKPGAGIVAHEAFHSACHVLRLVGLGPLDEKNEEAFAYLLMWTTVEIGRKVW